MLLPVVLAKSELIAHRYLRHERRRTDEAMARRLADEPDYPDEVEATHDEEETAVERPISLNDQRLAAVIGPIRAVGAQRVVDLGCGEGKLLQRDTEVTKVLGIGVSYRTLERAARRLHLDTMAPRQRERVELAQGALTYRDRRLKGFDVATVVAVIEHFDSARLTGSGRAGFAYACPATVILTTPNVEYNVLFEGMPSGPLRHRDHRFEWTRSELAGWTEGVPARNGYTVEISGIGPNDSDHGAPTQMAVFRR